MAKLRVKTLVAGTNLEHHGNKVIELDFARIPALVVRRLKVNAQHWSSKLPELNLSP